jgi:hypothetical protein
MNRCHSLGKNAWIRLRNAAVMTGGLIFTGAMPPSSLHAQDKETKASAGVMVGGVTPMGEIRIELPAGTDFMIEERVGDTLKVRKGPFRGDVPVQQTPIWQPPPAPDAGSSAAPSPSPTPGIGNPMEGPDLWPDWGQAAVKFWRDHRNGSLALIGLASAILVAALIIALVRRRNATREEGLTLKSDLEQIRHDLQKLHSLLEASRKQPPEVSLQQHKGAVACCPHCEKEILISSLKHGANRCAECGGEFLYE